MARQGRNQSAPTGSDPAEASGDGEATSAHLRDAAGHRVIVTENWTESDSHELDYCRCDCGERLEWPFQTGCKHYADETDDRELTFVCTCGFKIHDPSVIERECHLAGVSRERFEALLDAVARYSEHGVAARTYFAEEAWSQYRMSIFTIIDETGNNVREDSIDGLARVVADGLDRWCNVQGRVPSEL